MFRALADRGVTHGDIRSVNVVQVSAEWPSLPCPVGRCAGRVFMWRIIDFELSLRTSASLQECNLYYRDILEAFLEQLAIGHR